jgi:hypothetical protein
MKQSFTRVLFFTGLLGIAGTAVAQQSQSPSSFWDGARNYKVTVTNLVHGTPTTLIPTTTSTNPNANPFSVFVGTACPDNGGKGTRQVGEMLGLWVFVTHDQYFHLFTPGQPAMRELALLSQTGRPFFLRDALAAMDKTWNVFSIPSSFPPPNGPFGIVLCPGESLVTTVQATGANNYLSLAAMIFPTNDGFTGLSGVPLPTGLNAVTYYSPAYDSGSEDNDEVCGNIPSLIFAGFPFPLKTVVGGGGKVPGGNCPDGLGADNDINSNPDDPASPFNDPARAEGYVGVHPGIRGIGDLDPKVWGWDGNVLKVTIQRID